MKVNISKFYKKKDQTIKVEIHPHDTYSLFSTLSHIIHPALIAFKKERKKMPGVPIQFFNDDDEIDPKTGSHTNRAVDKAEKRYIEFLDESIWAFGQISNDCRYELDLPLNSAALKAYHIRLENALENFGRHFQTLWW